MAHKPPITGTVLFLSLTALLAVACIVLAKYLYLYSAASDQNPQIEFYKKSGELALQLALVVIIGGLLKLLIDWGTSQRARHIARQEQRNEFLKRVRKIHVAIQNARDLMNAHGSAKTWGEQSRRLMQLRSEVEEIIEDLKASVFVFAASEQAALIQNLENIVSYLYLARDEYIANHAAVDEAFKAHKSLDETMEIKNMSWVRDFVAGEGAYKNVYQRNLESAKAFLRAAVYGADANL